MDLGDILQMKAIIKNHLKLGCFYDDFNNCILELLWEDGEGTITIDTLNLGVKANI